MEGTHIPSLLLLYERATSNPSIRNKRFHLRATINPQQPKSSLNLMHNTVRYQLMLIRVFTLRIVAWTMDHDLQEPAKLVWEPLNLREAMAL
jgi:hypothetical protein